MNRHSVRMHEFVQRLLGDEDVSLDEIDGIVLEPKNEGDKSAIDDFWNELMIFTNDYDIRSQDASYNSNRRERVRAAFQLLAKREIV